ncbi:MAG TPA: T9SS type A sorting domain-containing protein [Ignavibacteria bacterium]|nr:T9SS type A sorting domain-containing protein [Ignavibacteria bacterium]HMQ98437.1 T9SS type A sorting domain-containing protein [Ignavibacteria bacterium]
MNFIKPFLIMIMLLTASGYSQTWVVQTNPAAGDIKQIHAINNQIVYALTVSQILKTTNGGLNWEIKITTPIGLGTSFNGFQWNNADEGYAWSYAGDTCLKTTNGGNNWEVITLPGNTGYMQFSEVNNLLNINFINSGYSGTRLYYTTNTGLNWYFNTASYGSMNTMGTMHFRNEETGFVNGGSSYTYYHVLLKTTNRGFSWTPVMNSGTDGYNSGGDFQFFGNIGYHISNKTYKTTNNGDNWTQLNTQGGGPYALFMHRTDRGWLGKQNGLLKTIDGCITWVNQNIGVTGIDINSVSFINWNTGWIAGESGHILKTTNGSGVIPPGNNPPPSMPANGSNGISTSPLLDWDPYSLALSGIEDSIWYGVQLSADSTFTTTLINTDTVTLTQYQVPAGILNHNIRYFWRVRAMNIGGEGPWSPVWNFRTGLVGLNQTGNEIPVQYKLYNNYPNPFNPVTRIKFDIPEGSHTKLLIYDINGKEISTLVNKQLNPGSYEAEFNASDLPSGVYFYKLSSGGYTDVKKMILVK